MLWYLANVGVMRTLRCLHHTVFGQFLMHDRNIIGVLLVQHCFLLRPSYDHHQHPTPNCIRFYRLLQCTYYTKHTTYICITTLTRQTSLSLQRSSQGQIVSCHLLIRKQIRSEVNSFQVFSTKGTKWQLCLSYMWMERSWLKFYSLKQRIPLQICYQWCGL